MNTVVFPGNKDGLRVSSAASLVPIIAVRMFIDVQQTRNRLFLVLNIAIHNTMVIKIIGVDKLIPCIYGGLMRH